MVIERETDPAIIELKRFGIKYREDPQFELGQLDPERRVQVRDLDHYAPRENVERFRYQMEGGARFPAIIVTEDGWLVDGNTRTGAALKRNQKLFPAIILDIQWGTASEARRTELRILAGALNAQNGQSLTRAETRRLVADALSRKLTSDHISRLLGVNTSTINTVRRETAAAERLERVGLRPDRDEDGAEDRGVTFGDVPLRALGHAAVLDLNDEPFKELALLARASGLNASEITGFAKELKALGSDTAQLERLGALRAELGERIREKELTGTGHPPIPRQLRQHLGFILAHAENQQSLVETNPHNIAAHLDGLRRAIAILQAALRAQEQQ